MQTLWLQHLKDPKDREEFKKLILGSSVVLDKLSEIVYNISLESQSVKQSDYSNPSWAYEQAHRNGRVEALKEVLTILNLDKR